MIAEATSDLMTVDEVSNVLRISKLSVYRMISSGEMKHVRVLRRIFVRKNDLDGYIEDHTFVGKA